MNISSLTNPRRVDVQETVRPCVIPGCDAEIEMTVEQWAAYKRTGQLFPCPRGHQQGFHASGWIRSIGTDLNIPPQGAGAVRNAIRAIMLVPTVQACNPYTPNATTRGWKWWKVGASGRWQLFRQK